MWLKGPLQRWRWSTWSIAPSTGHLWEEQAPSWLTPSGKLFQKSLPPWCVVRVQTLIEPRVGSFPSLLISPLSPTPIPGWLIKKMISLVPPLGSLPDLPCGKHLEQLKNYQWKIRGKKAAGCPNPGAGHHSLNSIRPAVLQSPQWINPETLRIFKCYCTYLDEPKYSCLWLTPMAFSKPRTVFDAHI